MKAINPKASAIRLYEACAVSMAKNSPLSNKVRIMGSDNITKPKIEGTPTGVWCTQFSVEDIMKLDIAALYAIAMEDTGRIIPGHGGVLDRIDGLIFVFPTIYILNLVLYFLT